MADVAPTTWVPSADEVARRATATEDPGDRIEVRLLGPLQVRRPDGTLVHPREWRTGKTVDLLRILALRAGRAVSIDEILEALWPDVDERHGRGSLRNALGQLRKLLGQNAVERRPDGLVLHDAWVDTAALAALANEARRHAREGRLAAAVRVAREADALHLGELRANDPDALWVAPVRAGLETTFRELILDAGENAVELGWMRDGLELAQRALDADPTSERAFRVLMRAYAGLGETESALRAYERCRTVLAEELGIDPSAQTRALHIQALSVEAREPSPVPVVGRERELGELCSCIQDAMTARRPLVAHLAGVSGAGRTRLAHEAARRLGLELVQVTPGAGDLCERVVAALAGQADRPTDDLGDIVAGTDGVLVLVPDGDSVPQPERRSLLAALGAAQGRLTVVLRTSGAAHARAADDVAGVDGRSAGTVAVQVLPLAPESLSDLATSLLAGPPTQELLAELWSRSDGVPGRAIAALDEWTRSGLVAATSGGLTLAPPRDRLDAAPDVAALLSRAMESLGAADLQVLHCVALLGRAVRPALLQPLVSTGGQPVELTKVVACLDRLVDLQLLTVAEEGYVVRDPLLRQAIESWLRPSVRRRLHAEIAQQVHIPTQERVRHWRAAGEIELASAASLDAAREAVESGDVVAARSHLLVVTELAQRLGALPGDLADLFEQLGDACAGVERVEEAAEHYRRAGDLLAESDQAAAGRLAGKLTALQRVRPVDAAEEPPARPAAPSVASHQDETQESEEELLAAVARADGTPDVEQQVLVRLALVERRLVPQRQLVRARQVTVEALELAGEGRLRSRCTALHVLADVLLGNARSAAPALEAAWQPHGADDDAGLPAVLRCLAAHDLGDGDFAIRWSQTESALSPLGIDWTWARVRMLTERGSLAMALAEDRRPQPPDQPPLQRQLRWLASASLQAALGRDALAVELLQSALADAEEEGCSLLLPEVTARLVLLTAESDPRTAVKHFELFDWAAGSDIGHPREGFLRLLARAAIRAGQQELDRAAAAAANAARIAQDSGLLLLASEGYLAQARYLFAGGWSSGARLATAGAARCLRAAGTAG